MSNTCEIAVDVNPSVFSLRGLASWEISLSLRLCATGLLKSIRYTSGMFPNKEDKIFLPILERRCSGSKVQWSKGVPESRLFCCEKFDSTFLVNWKRPILHSPLTSISKLTSFPNSSTQLNPVLDACSRLSVIAMKISLGDIELGVTET